MNLPFSPTREAGGFVFLSGQGGFDESGALVGDAIEAQTEQTLRNVARLLAENGCAMSDVVACLVHLVDLDDFPPFNEVYARHFEEPRPTRTTVGARLVAGMRVEVTVVARRPG
jgi:2-iminobutanoate/2-iminopropanoate deaminase